MAVKLIGEGRRIARRRGTMDLIFEQEKERELIDARNRFVEIVASDVKLGVYGSEAQRNSEQARAIGKVLNIHELTSVAISEGVIDERVYRKWFNNTFIADYTHAKDYIQQVRIHRDNKKLFLVFEKTAARWSKDRAWNADPSWFARKKVALNRIWLA